MVNRTDTTLEAVRELSRRLFGTAYRIEIAVAIADARGLANQSDLEAALPSPPGKSGVQAELQRLRTARLLGPPTKMGAKRYMTAVDCSFWQMCREMSGRAVELVGEPPYD